MSLTPLSEWRRINRITYSRSRYYGRSSAFKGLTELEREAIEACFPPPPAHVLVCGCGSGRELVAFAEMGYRVSGVDLAKELLENARQVVPQQSLHALVCSSYEDLDQQAVGDQLSEPNAVVIAWGSFLMISGDYERTKALIALRKICPRGPILLSFEMTGEIGPRRSALRRLIGALLPATLNKTEPSMYTPISGLYRLMTKAELFKIVEEAEQEVRRVQIVENSISMVLDPRGGAECCNQNYAQ